LSCPDAKGCLLDSLSSFKIEKYRCTPVLHFRPVDVRSTICQRINDEQMSSALLARAERSLTTDDPMKRAPKSTVSRAWEISRHPERPLGAEGSLGVPRGEFRVA
jgi:hypothetical protein